MSQVLSRQDANDTPIARPWLLLVAYIVVTGALYSFVTHVPLAPVALIPASTLDRAIPVLPGTVPLYLSYLFAMPALVWLGRGRAWLLPVFFAGALAAGLCLIAHLLHPTAVAWPPAERGWIAWLQRLDSPLAASPSGHVALPVAIAIVLLALRQRSGALFVAWSALLMVTVLTTGQHRVADVGWGSVVGIVAGAVTLALLRAKADLRTIAAALLEWACTVVAIRVAVALGAWYLYAVAVLVVATRQHALFILYHDATHYHVTRRRGLNDFLINVAIGVPGLVPVEFYRPLHLAHHRNLGTAQDPERSFLYHDQPWRFRPLDAWPLARQLLGDLFVLNMVRNMAAFRRAGGQNTRLGRPFHAAAAVWLTIVALLVWACSARTLVLVAALWFVPLLTLSVLLQKIRSMAEHSGGPHATPGWADWTYSWQTGWIGRVFVWPYHINLHLQHHRNPAVPWHALPDTVGDDEHRLRSHDLAALLWRGRATTARATPHAAEQRDANRPSPPIPQRRLQFPLDDTIPRYWYRGWCHVTRFFDAFSIMFPLGERFFIDSVSHFRDRIPADTQLAEDVAGFIYQEATHIREHRAYNHRLAAQGAPVDALEAMIRRRQQNSLAAMPAATRLALTACLEHYTAILADQLLRHPEILDGADPQMAAIWQWHAIEETEHKAVAFDVLAAIEPRPLRNYLLRCGAMLAVSVYFVFDLAYFIYRLTAADRQRGNLREWVRLQRWLFVHPGIFTRILPAWLFWFSPSFHPDRIGSSDALRTARQTLEERV